MKKILLCLILTVISNLSFAADPLNLTVWETVDDKSAQPTAQVKFFEDKNGLLTATIQKILISGEENKCSQCKGKYYNKSLIGLEILKDLKRKKEGFYENGKIIDPETGAIYNFEARISKDGKILNGRGYLGISLLGRNQTWKRIK